MHLQQAPTFGNATGISSSSPHFLKKMNITNVNDNNNSSIVLPRIKNNSTTTQACAACKYQRRKCEPNCILSPYFPHNRQAQFLNAHKLFGVSNITKIIRDLSPADKDQAMKTIIFQSDVRANDPVGGCYRIIKDLQFMIECYQAELDLVMHQLSICRAQHAQAQAQTQVQTKDQQEDQPNSQLQYLPFMTSDQAANNCSDPNSNVINADPLSAYSPSSLQYSYHQNQQEQLSLQLGGLINNRGEEDNFILVNENARYESNVQDDLVNDKYPWARQDEQEQERMVNYCLNENEEIQCTSKDSFDHKKDVPSFERSTNKLNFDVEEDHKGGSSHDGTILNDAKNLCTLEGSNGLIQEEEYENEEGSDEWFRLTNSKRRKTM